MRKRKRSSIIPFGDFGKVQEEDQKEFEQWEAAINADPAETRKPVSRVSPALLDMMAPAGGPKVAHAR